MGRQPPSIMGLQHCHGHGNNQLLRLNAAGQLGVGEWTIYHSVFVFEMEFLLNRCLFIYQQVSVVSKPIGRVLN